MLVRQRKAGRARPMYNCRRAGTRRVSTGRSGGRRNCGDGRTLLCVRGGPRRTGETGARARAGSGGRSESDTDLGGTTRQRRGQDPGVRLEYYYTGTRMWIARARRETRAVGGAVGSWGRRARPIASWVGLLGEGHGRIIKLSSRAGKIGGRVIWTGIRISRAHARRRAGLWG